MRKLSAVWYKSLSEACYGKNINHRDHGGHRVGNELIESSFCEGDQVPKIFPMEVIMAEVNKTSFSPRELLVYNADTRERYKI